MTVDVYRAHWVVPITSAPVRDGAVAVRDGRITYVGPRSGTPPGAMHDLGDALILPGLVNAHTHLELTAMRGFLEELSFHQWIATLQRAKTTVLTPKSMLDSAKLGIAEGLRAGVTTFADTCDSGVALEAMHAMGVRGIMYQEVFGPEPEARDEAMASLRRKLDIHRTLRSPLLTLGVSPHAPYTVSDRLFEAVRDLAREQGLAVAIHIAESADEDALVTEAAGPFAEGHRMRGIPVARRADSPIALLDRLGILAARPLLIHCVRARESDIGAMASHQCSVAHCPASNAKLGHGVAPIHEMVDAGIAVGVGSDSMASNNRMHILEEARLAVLAQRARGGVFATFPASRALEMATIGGARSVGLERETGSLEVGKAADLCAFRLDEPHAIPNDDPIATAVFALGGASASMVLVAGQPRVVDGRLVGEDPGLIARVRATSAALHASRMDPPQAFRAFR
ncbi:MAG: amidohydrolase family protein [Gemmatimonadaceae bacterium]